MVANRVSAYGRWLVENRLSDAQSEQRLQNLLARLAEDRLTIAFVAEFSRGKSELINAIFFADYKRRILPAASGRTTMCPTELMWDAQHPPQLMLLPIETRADSKSIDEFKRSPADWFVQPLDLGSPEAIARAFQKVRETKLVPIEEAREFALLSTHSDDMLSLRTDGRIEIPCWRHALVNFPHPLLEQGLVILDTPGLNAIGTEPELTLNLLPNAHAILFILAIDTGVTKSDLQVWRDYIAPSNSADRFRFAVLNKIDTVWDGLREDDEINSEIDQQSRYVAEILQIAPERVLPVSAQKGLLAKISQDEALLDRSRIKTLERTLATEIIPYRQDILRASARDDVTELIGRARGLLEARVQHADTQIGEIRSLKGRNLNVVAEMVRKVRAEKVEFDRSYASYQPLRREFAEMSNDIFTQLGIEALADEAKKTAAAVKKSLLSTGVRAALAGYFQNCRGRLKLASHKVQHIHSMMERLYTDFDLEHGLKLGRPAEFSLTRYQNELDRLERLYHQHFDTVLAMLTTEALTLLQKFFETIASQIHKVFQYANRESELWLKALIAPLETQIREHQQMLKRRLDSIRKIHDSTESLVDRVRELEQHAAGVKLQIEQIDRLTIDIETVLADMGDNASAYAAVA